TLTRSPNRITTMNRNALAQALGQIRRDAAKRKDQDHDPRNVEARRTWDSLYRGSPDFATWADSEAEQRATGRRTDAVDTAFAARQLEYVYAKAVEREFEELAFADPQNGLIPWDTSVDPGAETFVYYLTETSGTAVILATMAGGQDLPSPSIYGTEVQGR